MAQQVGGQVVGNIGMYGMYTAETIPLDHWQLLHFETYDQKRQTVEAEARNMSGSRLVAMRIHHKTMTSPSAAWLTDVCFRG